MSASWLAHSRILKISPAFLSNGLKAICSTPPRYERPWPDAASCIMSPHHYALWAKDPSIFYDINVTGTCNVLTAARLAGIERTVYCSTIGAIGLPADGGLGTEKTPVSLDQMAGHYKRSKYLAEQEVLKFASEGLPVVIVNPSAPVGAGDVKPTPTGQVIVDFMKGRMPAYIETGLNIVDVDDVAAGHLLAMEKGRQGERYILGCKESDAEGRLRYSQRADRHQSPFAPAASLSRAASRLCEPMDRQPDGTTTAYSAGRGQDGQVPHALRLQQGNP